nr:heavy metal translocating P-type ATPase metal-binding domain-containing protein [Ignavibacteria bacterium]
MPQHPEILTKHICYHCGDECIDEISYDEKSFCCVGCKSVYELLFQSNLCSYYTLENHPGINLKESGSGIKFNYLDDKEISKQIIEFSNDEITKVTFYIPSIHCSSCIYLLEHLYKIDHAVVNSKTDFTQKKIFITYKTGETSLRKIAELLYSIGYEPAINIDDLAENDKPKVLKKLYYKIGIAGFCFGNIMLFSFPEYLSLGNLDPFYKHLFGYLNILLSSPVFFYCASDYFKSAFIGLKQKHINLDVPISLGIAVIFLRSVFEVISGFGAGYFDSLTGLIFFLLIGKLIQTKTFDFLNFERNYKSYFPISVTILKDKTETTTPINKLAKGDRIVIRNGELIPADSILFKGNAKIDYSFVTGESTPVEKVFGEIIYAGGRQEGDLLELEVVRDVSQSYLTQLWNNDAFKKTDTEKTKLNDVIAKYFTYITLAVAITAGAFWLNKDIKIAVNVFTAVLVIACPCALALAGPFALSNTMRIFGKNKFYLKNTGVIEKLSKIDSIVFDKTGTITQVKNAELNYYGNLLSNKELSEIKSLVKNSTHPLSQKIYESVKCDDEFEIKNYKEFPGKGIKGFVGENEYKIGMLEFVMTGDNKEDTENKASKVYVSKNGKLKGYFLILNYFRKGLSELITDLNQSKELTLLSGDNDNERQNLQEIFGTESTMKFYQKPEDKLHYIKSLQDNNKRVLMIGDGLNDAGALKQSDAGIAVTESVTCFSPSCDAILS